MSVPAWGDPADWTNPPPLEGEESADVCVVGLGGSGLAAVGALLDAGASVVGLDAGPVAAGAAGRNGGFLLAGTVRFHHEAVAILGRERAVALYRETLAEIDRLAAELGPEIVRLVGSERLPADDAEAEDCARHLEALRADGLPGESLDTDGRAGLLIPGDGSVDPLARCRRLASAAVDRGARLHASSPAVEIAGDRVRTPGGSVSCRAVVVTVDGGLEHVLDELAHRVRSSRLQMLGTAPLPLRCPRPVCHRGGYDYWQQRPDGRVMLGGGRDRWSDEEWGAPAEPSAAVQAYLDGLLRERFGEAARVTHRWAGIVAYTEDWTPILEEVRPGVIVSGALCGHGNVIGSLGGRAAAAIALGQPPPPFARALRPENWA